MFSVFVFEISHSNHRISTHTRAITLYPTGRLFWGGADPGTSCQATISLSLRYKSHLPIEDSHYLSTVRKAPVCAVILPTHTGPKLLNQRSSGLRLSLYP